MTVELDGAVRIAWQADGLTEIHVAAPTRTRRELDAFASVVADVALLERTVRGVRVALRDRYPGALEMQIRDSGRDAAMPYLLVTMRPPKREPDPRAIDRAGGNAGSRLLPP
ncbi:MAG: hypothetical protein ACHQZR_04605 [Candidatus Limnocylindrales bacterium]